MAFTKEPPTHIADATKDPAATKDWLEEQKRRCLLERTQLEINRSTFRAHWLDLAYHFAPYAERFLATDTNQGRKKNFEIIKSTGMRAARTLRAGMMASVTSPQRPWFSMQPIDPKLEDDSEVMQWCFQNTQRMHTILSRSNFYEAAPRLYGDGSIFGSALVWMEEDFEECVRFYNVPTGSYCVSLNDRGQCDTILRDVPMTVRQVVEKFGRDRRTGKIDWSHITKATQDLWDAGNYEVWINVMHMVMPNADWDPSAFGIKSMRYLSFWLERGASAVGTASTPAGGQEALPEKAFLSIGGYQRFPGLYFVWERTGSDFYGTSCPGMDSLGDNRELQVLRRRMAQATDKMLNPPLVATHETRQQKSSTQPGDITYVKEIGPNVGMKPVYEVNFDLSHGQNLSDEIVVDINACFFVDLFRSILDDDRRMPATAEEVKTKKGEGLLLLGPVFQNLNQGVLDPCIMMLYEIAMEQGWLMPLPERLKNSKFKIVYTSIMAEAMKLMSAQAMQTFAGFLTQTSTLNPASTDMVDFDEFNVQYGKTIGVPPLILKGMDVVDKIRAQRAKVAQAQAAQAQAAQQADTAQKLSAAKTGDPSMLTHMMEQSQAGNPTSAMPS